MNEPRVILSGDPAEADRRLWYFLRRKRLGGFKFRHRRPVGPYMAEFACDERHLIVEIDGGRCATGAEHDQLREVSLAVHGYRILRFHSNNVLRQTAVVLAAIHAELAASGTRSGAHRGEPRARRRRRARTTVPAARLIPETTG